MPTDDRAMPALLQELLRIDIDYDGGNGIDFEPHADFLSEEETREWIHAWTGNTQLDGSEYLVFGQDGSGGHAAIWRIRTGVSLLDQPIVFFGSEGELGVVARNFSDYLWLLAGGVGPYEAVAYDGELGKGSAEFEAFARLHAGSVERTPKDIIAAAREEFPSFVEDVQALCRYN
jgi:hypothetical protein